MIQYPVLDQGMTIGVTAPSSGAAESHFESLRQAGAQLEREGFKVVYGETVWTQNKAKSAPARQRARELNQMMQSDAINLVIPPWGGELLIEILPDLDFNQMKKKWVMGYSDISLLLLTITLNTGIATAHGTNFFDFRGKLDATTSRWKDVLSTQTGATVVQHSSEKFQKIWQSVNSSGSVFNLTEPTEWKTVSDHPERVRGRLLGGCIDAIRHLIGTPFGDVRGFREKHFGDEPVLWYLENCEMNTADLRRSLVQMELAGWFENCSAILFGRSAANQPVQDYTAIDVYQEMADELNVPIIYDIDCGHVPPQITFINGAAAEIKVEGGKGTVIQTFR